MSPLSPLCLHWCERAWHLAFSTGQLLAWCFTRTWQLVGNMYHSTISSLILSQPWWRTLQLVVPKNTKGNYDDSSYGCHALNNQCPNSNKHAFLELQNKQRFFQARIVRERKASSVTITIEQVKKEPHQHHMLTNYYCLFKNTSA